MTLRCFFAIELTTDWRRTLEDAKTVILDLDPSWREARWIRPENLHITLAFMPKVPDEDVGQLLARTADALSDAEPFDLRLAGVKAVPRTARARMIWARAESDPDMQSVVRRLERSVAEYAGDNTGRAFRPHVTLCRARNPAPVSPDAVLAASRLVESASRPVSVSYVTLFKSTLGPGGPTYDALGTVPLGVD
ncbi:MAG: RNA 2',3'-cyclic phosphodiesterase [Coriobacteriia bacterium]